jgi:hypothetical protein
MTKFVRLAALAAATTIVATPVAAAPVPVSNGPVTATARITKPLTLEKVSDMDFGSIAVQDAGTATMNVATGAVTCTANLTCTGATTAAEYKVKGTNNQVVQITKPNVTLTNTDTSGTTMTLVLAGPTTYQIPNAGTTGGNFTLGGSIAVAASQRDGTYVGNLAVTVEY